MAGISVISRQLRTLLATRRAEGQTDGHLLEQFAAQRDEEAFAALLERHGPMVLGVCRRILHDEHRAEDAFQATFLVLVRKASAIRKQPSLASWLHGVALRLARNAKTEAARSKRPDTRSHSQAAVDALAEASWRESQAILDQELQRLPENYRLPLVLCYLEGLTRDEAAARLGWSANKLRGFLERGRARLRCQLRRRGVTLSATASTLLLADTLLAKTVPPLLAVATIHAAARFAVGTPLAACGISATVGALTEGGLKMVVSKKITAFLALALCTVVLGSGVGIFAQPTEPAEGRQPTEPTAPAIAPQVLNKDQPKKEPVDRFGDPLPSGAIARLGTVRFRAPAEAYVLAFAPDGKTIAVSSRGGLFLFAADSGKRIKCLADDGIAGREQNTLAFSTDGKHLAAYLPASPRWKKDVVRVWDLTGKLKPQEYDVEHPIWLGWSSNSAPLAVCLEQGAVSLCELVSSQARRFKCADLERPELSDYILCACTPHGKALAVADEKSVIHVWDTDTGAKRCTTPPIKDNILRGLALSVDGRQLATLQQDRAAPYNHAVHIWDAMTGQALRKMAADHRNMSTLAFAPDGKTLATAGWNGIRCWDVATGQERSRSEGLGANTLKIAFSGDGQTLVTLQRYSGAFHLWDAATGKRKAEPAGHTGEPYGTSFSPDGRRLASCGGVDGTIHIWDLATSKSLFHIHRPGRWVRRAAFSRDGRALFSTWTDDNLWISDAATGERQHVLKLEDPERPGTYQSAISMEHCAAGKTLVAFSYYRAKKDGGEHSTERLLTGWDSDTRKQLFRRRLPSMEAWSAVSADARLFALAHPSSGREKAPGTGPMRIEDLATGKLLLTFPVLEGQTWPLAFSPDGRWLASFNSNYKRRKEGDPASTGASLLLWEVATATEVLSLPMGAGQYPVAFSPDGRLLALMAPERDIVVWDVAQGHELRRFKQVDAEVTWLAFAPDGQRLVSGLADSTLLIWDVGVPATPKTGLTAKALAKVWDDLAGSDPPRAFRAQWALVSMPEATLALFQKHLKPALPVDPRRLQKLIDELESQKFLVRNAANKELEELGALAAGALRQALAKNSSLEMRRRIDALLDKLRGPVTRPELLRAVRAVAILEHIASSEARKLLETLVKGDPNAPLSQEAEQAFKRLAQKSRPNK